MASIGICGVVGALPQQDPRRLADDRGAVGNILAYDGACADLNIASNLNPSYEHGTRADQAAGADDRGAACDLADGHILINTAVRPEDGVAGDKNAMEPVGQRGDALNLRARAEITAVAVGAAAEEKGQNVPPCLVFARRCQR